MALLAIDTSGSIGMLYPPPGAQDSIAPGNSVATRSILVTKPAGLETVKVMVTTQWTDFSFLKQSAVHTRAVAETKPPQAKSLLERLLFDGTAMPRTRNLQLAEDEDIQQEKLSSWAAKNVDIVVRDHANSIEATQLK